MANISTLPTSHPTKEAAPILGVSERTLRVMLNEGKIHGFKVGTGGKKAQWRITTTELERFMGEGVAND